jgi:2-polyprenyl-3-methyl-5-hydroxy-6-metoxy-1,4-benzoquinol methylase
MPQAAAFHVDRAAQRYYETFSPKVGTRDWLAPNPRHERLKLLVDEALTGVRAADVLDVGCGTGVMTAHLRRYGAVTGVDFSHAAIDVARRLVPGVAFVAGSLDDLPHGGRWDVITLFDVLEHIPRDERPAFLAQLAQRLRPGGRVLASTPYPDYTEWRRTAEPEALQIVDEAVRVEDVVPEARAAGLDLVRYETFDVWAGSPEYQWLVLAPSAGPGGPALLTSTAHARRMRRLTAPRGRRARRLALAWTVARRGELAAAWFFLKGAR